MHTVIASVLVGLAVVACVFAIAKWPLFARTLDRAKLSRFLRGMIAFGLEGTYLRLKERYSKDEIIITKRGIKGGSTSFEVQIWGAFASERLTESFVSDIRILKTMLERAPEGEADGGGMVKFVISGESATDPALLEGVLRLTVRHLGHSRDSKYRIKFSGPADIGALSKAYGLRR